MPGSAATTTEEFVYNLAGTYKYEEGDYMLWARPEFDDSGWRMIRLPSNFSWDSLYQPFGTIWYRVSFVPPPELQKDDLGLYLGRISEADQVYFNGMKIGATGRLDENFIDAANILRVYRLPAELVRRGEKNLIAIRVGYSQAYAGFFDNEFKIGDYDHLKLEAMERQASIRFFEGVSLSAVILFMLLSVFLYLNVPDETEFLFFGMFLAVYGLFFFLDSSVFYETGLKSVFIQNFTSFLLGLQPVIIILFLSQACREQLSDYMIFMLYVLLSLALLLLIPVHADFNIPLFMARATTLFFCAAYYLFVSIKAVVKHRHEAVIILVGVSGYVTGLWFELVGGYTFQNYSGLFLKDYATGFFMASLMVAMTARYGRLQREFARMSEKVLNAHEEERKRIARELHDILGHMLLSLQMKIHTLNVRRGQGAAVDGAALEGLVADTTAVIAEARRISYDLRPSYIEDMHFVDALLWHARHFEEKSGIKIVIEAGQVTDPAPQIKDNLYRIYQEALNNALKHSKCSRVDISFSQDSSRYTLSIRDNGTGFAIDDAGVKKGIGIDSIRERAQLMHGVCAITSSRSGTRITVEVPAL